MLETYTNKFSFVEQIGSTKDIDRFYKVLGSSDGANIFDVVDIGCVHTKIGGGRKKP